MGIEININANSSTNTINSNTFHDGKLFFKFPKTNPKDNNNDKNNDSDDYSFTGYICGLPDSLIEEMVYNINEQYKTQPDFKPCVICEHDINNNNNNYNYHDKNQSKMEEKEYGWIYSDKGMFPFDLFSLASITNNKSKTISLFRYQPVTFDIQPCSSKPFNNKKQHYMATNIRPLYQISKQQLSECHVPKEVDRNNIDKIYNQSLYFISNRILYHDKQDVLHNVFWVPDENQDVDDRCSYLQLIVSEALKSLNALLNGEGGDFYGGVEPKKKQIVGLQFLSPDELWYVYHQIMNGVASFHVDSYWKQRNVDFKQDPKYKKYQHSNIIDDSKTDNSYDYSKTNNNNDYDNSKTNNNNGDDDSKTNNNNDDDGSKTNNNNDYDDSDTNNNNGDDNSNTNNNDDDYSKTNNNNNNDVFEHLRLPNEEIKNNNNLHSKNKHAPSHVFVDFNPVVNNQGLIYHTRFVLHAVIKPPLNRFRESCGEMNFINVDGYIYRKQMAYLTSQVPNEKYYSQNKDVLYTSQPKRIHHIVIK